MRIIRKIREIIRKWELKEIIRKIENNKTQTQKYLNNLHLNLNKTLITIIKLNSNRRITIKTQTTIFPNYK